jgi:NAD dependent epimerase/dehydratase family enzyme
VCALQFLLEQDHLSGAVNLTAPNPVTNAEVTTVMGKVLGRPTLLPAPAFALKAALGEFSSEVLGSSRVVPAVLEEAQFGFQDPTIESAVRSALADR